MTQLRLTIEAVFVSTRTHAMLVLSRKKEESIMVGDDIKLTIIEIRGDKVRIGIEAPRDVTVHRKEIYEIVKREKMDQDKADKAEEERRRSE